MIIPSDGCDYFQRVLCRFFLDEQLIWSHGLNVALQLDVYKLEIFQFSRKRRGHILSHTYWVREVKKNKKNILI